MRKDIQYSQFQNYELTYAHFVRFPSWERWPPGSSPGRNSEVETSQISRIQVKKSNSNSLFVLALCFLTIISNSITISEVPTTIQNKYFWQYQQIKRKLFEPIRIWSGSLAISWITFDHVFHNIKSDLISSKWRSKISWYWLWKSHSKFYTDIWYYLSECKLHQNKIFLQHSKRFSDRYFSCLNFNILSIFDASEFEFYEGITSTFKYLQNVLCNTRLLVGMCTDIKFLRSSVFAL